jgi:Fe-S cluster assembly scaffold protein SufB
MPKKQTQAEKDALIAAAEEAERLEAEAEAQRLEEERLAREEEERRIDAERKEFRTQELELLATEAEAGLVEAVAFASRLQAEEEIEVGMITALALSQKVFSYQSVIFFSGQTDRVGKSRELCFRHNVGECCQHLHQPCVG